MTNPTKGVTISSRLKGVFGLVNSPLRSERSPVNTSWKEFNPRIGLAYRLTNKTIIRTGYGIFYLPNDVAWNNAPHNMFMNTANTAWITTVNDAGILPLPGHDFSSPFGPTGPGIVLPPGRSQTFANTFANGSSGPVTTNPPAYSQEWNFNIQHELPDGTLIDVAYAGSKGTYLPMHSRDLDQLPDQYLPGRSAGYTVADLKASVPNPFYGLVQGQLTQPTVQAAQLLLPFPQFSDVSIAEPNDRDSIYHSFQMKIQKRLSHGGTVLASYTISKLISDTNNEINWLGDAAPSWGDTDAYNLRNERSLDGFDVPQRFVLGYVLDLPDGKGKRFASSLSPVANKLVGGWGIDGNRWQDAAEEYMHALAVDPKQPGLHASFAQAYLHAGKLNKAEAEFRLELGLDHQNEQAWLGLAETQLAKGQAIAALEAARKVWEISPEFLGLPRKFPTVELPEGTAKALVADLQAAPEGAARDFLLAGLYAPAGGTAQADERWKTFQTDFPAWQKTRDGVAGVGADRNPCRAHQYAGCAHWLESRKPMSHSELLLLGKTQFTLQQYGHAADTLAKLLAIDKGNAEASYWLALTYQALGAECYDRLEESFPESWRTLELRAEGYHLREAANEAIQEYQLALQLRPDEAKLHEARGELFLKKKSYDPGCAKGRLIWYRARAMPWNSASARWRK